MFELKLKSGAILNVDSVEERYSNRGESVQNNLSIRINSDTAGMEAILESLKADGALDEIQVTDETGLQTIFTTYQNIQTVSRTLVPGGAVMTISLTAEVEAE